MDLTNLNIIPNIFDLSIKDSIFFSVKLMISFFSGLLFYVILLIIKNQWLKTFHHKMSFLILPVVTSGITTVISGNIALSLGMIGALSIVRFRNPVKNPFELVIYFSLITMGIISSVNLTYLLIFNVVIYFILFCNFVLTNRFKINILSENISFAEGYKINYLEVITSKEILNYSKENLINKSYNSNESNYYYRYASLDKNLIEEIYKKITDDEKANIISIDAKYSN